MNPATLSDDRPPLVHVAVLEWVSPKMARGERNANEGNVNPMGARGVTARRDGHRNEVKMQGIPREEHIPLRPCGDPDYTREGQIMLERIEQLLTEHMAIVLAQLVNECELQDDLDMRDAGLLATAVAIERQICAQIDVIKADDEKKGRWEGSLLDFLVVNGITGEEHDAIVVALAHSEVYGGPGWTLTRKDPLVSV
jgi:hypothetical protein